MPPRPPSGYAHDVSFFYSYDPFPSREMAMDICRLCMEASNLNQSMADETIQVMVEDCIQIKVRGHF